MKQVAIKELTEIRLINLYGQEVRYYTDKEERLVSCMFLSLSSYTFIDLFWRWKNTPKETNKKGR